MDRCPFCQIVRGKADAYRIYESDTALAFLDINPAAAYHTLVVPKVHAADVLDVPAESWRGVMDAVKHVAGLYRERLGLAAFEIACVSGAEAQQSVFHLHVHIVPRHAGDGQDTEWTVHPELRGHFAEMLERLEG